MSFEGFRKNFIRVFIVIQITVLFAWTAPKYKIFNWWVIPLRKAVTPFMHYSGMWQSWGMFAPHPRMIDISFTAVATMKDKSKRIWSIPSPINFGFFERHAIDRYRKWANDRIKASDEDTCNEVGRFIKEQLDEPNNPVESIVLIRGQKRISLENPKDPEWSEGSFFHYVPKGSTPGTKKPFFLEDEKP